MNSTDQILQLASKYESICVDRFIKQARIRKLPNGKYRVLSESGKNLGTCNSKSEAKKRLQEVEYFKHQDKNDVKDKEIIDLTNAFDFSFSAIIREMRQNASKDQVRLYLSIFKKEFDNAVKKRLQKPEKIALQNSLIKFNKKNKVKLKKKLVKNASVAELGDPSLVGKYLSDIVRFTLNKLPYEKRNSALNSLRKKFYSFNADELSKKNMPPTASIGQSITFVKHVLLNQEPLYIREVLNNLVRNL